MGPVQCYMIEPTDQVRQALRRSSPSVWDKELKKLIYAGCTAHDGRDHEAAMQIEDAPVILSAEGYIQNSIQPLNKNDPRWPIHCACGYQFQEGDEWRLSAERIYRRTDTGVLITLREAEPGAMWYAPWIGNFFHPQLPGGPIIVKLPDGTDWQPDSMATNCTMRDDFKQERHHCWVIKGEPPNLTVSKDGPTCAAGAGSIQSPHWHGFLRDGYLVE